ncbi:hypothetical protein Tco_1381743 [Tanacetum coccineum]
MTQPSNTFYNLSQICLKFFHEKINEGLNAIASGTIPPKMKGSKKKADTYTTTKQEPPTVPKEKKEKKSGKGKHQ